MWEHVAMTFDVVVDISLRPGISDPEGATIERSCGALGFDGISGVAVGKTVRFSLDAVDEAAAQAEVEDLCNKFLTNPVIEEAEVRLTGVAAAGVV